MMPGTVLLLLLIAPAVGSFLGVLADRLPRGEDAIATPSHCRSCKTRLTPRDLVPLWSYLRHGGCCRHCGIALPGWLLLIELGAAGVAGLALLRGGTPYEVWQSAGYLWLLLALAFSDALWLRLPDALTAALLAVALGAAWPLGLLTHALAGALLGAGSFLLLRLGYAAWRRREGLGLGDVKLIAGLGAAVGPLDLPWLVLIAAMLALAGAMLRAALTRVPAAADTALPFGTALCGSGAVLWLVGKTLF